MQVRYQAALRPEFFTYHNHIYFLQIRRFFRTTAYITAYLRSTRVQW